jgi:anti-sigma factor RsiW
MTDDAVKHEALTDEERTLTPEEAMDQQIVAYLDGELDREAAVAVERRLADDPAYRARLSRLQKAWDLLDNLGQREADEDFTHSTVAMITVKAGEQSQDDEGRARLRKQAAWAGMGGLALVAAVAAYMAVDHRLNAENRALVRDLPVIERIDQYSNVESVEFLKRLQREGLFAAEVSDGG